MWSQHYGWVIMEFVLMCDHQGVESLTGYSLSLFLPTNYLNTSGIDADTV